MADSKQQIVIPGEQIATEEEYAAGKNAYVEDGSVKSTSMGVATFNDVTKEVSVKGNAVEGVRQGDIVLGKVVYVKESMVVIELKSSESGRKILTPSAHLAIRNVSTEFVKELDKMFKVGDIVRAKIAFSTPLITELLTNEKGLGVIKAYCSNCRDALSSSNGKLMCLSCGSVESRRWHEDELPPRMSGGFEDRGGRGFGGDRGRGGFSDRRPSFGDNRGPRRFDNRGPDRREGGFSDRRPSFGENRGPRNDNNGFRPDRGFNRGGMRNENRSNF
ncbi:MAG: exosome complex RNA-binding protein Csl4 [archaeon]